MTYECGSERGEGRGRGRLGMGGGVDNLSGADERVRDWERVISPQTAPTFYRSLCGRKDEKAREGETK